MESDRSNLPVFGFTVGDLNGIGPEVLMKSLRDTKILNHITPVIYGSAQALIFYKKLLNIKGFNFQSVKNLHQIHTNKVNLITVWDEEIKVEPGKPSQSTGQAALKSLLAASSDLEKGELDALITAPIDKSTMQSEEFQFPGHTDFLAQKFGADSSSHIMMMVGETLKVAVLCGHVPLHEVPSRISQESVLQAIQTLSKSLTKDFSIERPKIAVLGLNPHAGEEGLLGTEERDAISPAISKAKEQGIQAFGPFPADGFFGTLKHTDFDVVLAMYHDQGLIPFKTLEFDSGVNYTAGLSIIRTSPDHGTGYAIAGKGQAKNDSFSNAIFLAIRVLRNRRIHSEITSNPLQPKMQKQKES